MSILASELIWRRSATVNDTGSNGGRMSATAITSGVKNNIFPDVPQSERTAGSEKHRKIFIHVANDADLQLISPKVFVETQTPGDDHVLFFSATQTDTQAGITGSETKYGAGTLQASVTAGASQLIVDVEDGATVEDRIFANGCKIRVSDKPNINGAGNEEYISVSTVTWNANEATLNLSTNTVNGYTLGVTKVARVYEPADVGPTFASWVESPGGSSGAYDEATYPPVGVAPAPGDSIATVQQNWTLTFSTTTNFSVSGDELGVVGTGTTGGTFAPTNPNFSKPYFTLNVSGWTNPTWENGATITFTTSPAAIPIWYMRVVPAGAASLSGNSVIVAVDGESA